jgi:hypothetical protein
MNLEQASDGMEYIDYLERVVLNLRRSMEVLAEAELKTHVCGDGIQHFIRCTLREHGWYEFEQTPNSALEDQVEILSQAKEGGDK